MLLVLAGLLVWWVIPTVSDSYDCHSDWDGVPVIGGLLAMLCGLTTAYMGVKESDEPRSWANSVTFAGVALVLCAIAAFGQTVGSARCEPS